MTKDEQQALRLEVAAQVYQQMPVLPDNSPESPYVRSLGQKLVATIPQQYSWDRATWPDEAAQLLTAAIEEEPDDEIRATMVKVIEGESVCED